jgi:hypothetical protein
MTPDELKLHAARVTRAVVPNYSEIAKVVKNLSTAGVFNQFINFNHEIFRTTFNAAKIGMTDLAEGIATKNSALAAMGAKRLGSMTLVVAAGSAWGLSKFSKQRAGVSDEEEQAMRYVVLEYDATATWHFDEYEKGKSFSYANNSYFLQHAITTEALASASRGDTPQQAAQGFAKSLARMFLGDGGIVIGSAIEAFFNDADQWGNRISPAMSEGWEKKKAQALYFTDRAFTPQFLKEIERFIEAGAGKPSRNGEIYSVGDRVQRLAGVRVNRIDIPKRMAGMAHQFSRDLEDINKQFSRAEKDGRGGEAFAVAEGQRQELVGNMAQYFRHSLALGLSEEQTIHNLREARVPSKLILSVLDGKYIPAKQAKGADIAALAEEVAKMPAALQQKKLNQLAGEDVGVARSVINRVKSGMRDDARGVTERDRVIMSMQPKDRAEYIQQRMDELPDAASRKEYQQTLMRRGVIDKMTYYYLHTP